MSRALARPRNDLAQYDDLADHWWRPAGEFAALHWLAAARAELIPPPSRPGAVLLDLGCGGGLLAPHVRGYRHVGVDLVASAARIAASRGVEAVRGDAARLPLDDGSVDVAVAGELFEHLEDLDACIAEVARVLGPGGTLVCDTVNDTWWSRLSLVVVGERLPGGPPRGIHDPDLFVPPERLQSACARHGIDLSVRGLRWSAPEYLAFVIGSWLGRPPRRGVRMLPARSLSAVYQGVGRKNGRAADEPERGAARQVDAAWQAEGKRWQTR